MQYFINARMTVGPVELNPISIWNDPDKTFICTVQIDRGKEQKEYEHFYGCHAVDAQSKAQFFANGLGNARVLQKIHDLVETESIIKVDELLNLIKTANRWN